jgi:hypothetical protein
MASKIPTMRSGIRGGSGAVSTFPISRARASLESSDNNRKRACGAGGQVDGEESARQRRQLELSPVPRRNGGPHSVLSGDGSCFNAGGDVYWLTQSYDWIEDGQSRTSPADSHGHNAVAAEFGLAADGRLSVAPRGDYPVADPFRISCHDPHGQRTGEGNEAGPISGSGSYPGPLQRAPSRGATGSIRA